MTTDVWYFKSLPKCDSIGKFTNLVLLLMEEQGLQLEINSVQRNT